MHKVNWNDDVSSRFSVPLAAPMTILEAETTASTFYQDGKQSQIGFAVYEADLFHSFFPEISSVTPCKNLGGLQWYLEREPGGRG
jgi:hypothetical protein